MRDLEEGLSELTKKVNDLEMRTGWTGQCMLAKDPSRSISFFVKLYMYTVYLSISVCFTVYAISGFLLFITNEVTQIGRTSGHQDE